MFDIHYHLLFGLDDGPKDLESSVRLAEASIADGVTHIVATPHANDRYPFQPDLNREQRAMLQERFEGKLTIGLGCDFHLSYENLADLTRDPRKYSINGTQYLLVEFSNYGIPPNSEQMFFQMLTLGLVPIITHPERNPELMKNPNRMDSWLNMGCLVQLTAASLDERFGRKSKSLAFDLIRQNKAHIIASDAHSVTGRPPAMTKAFSLVESSFGRDTATKMCIENPSAVFHGNVVQHLKVVNSGDLQRPGRTAGFWRRMFGSR